MNVKMIRPVLVTGAHRSATTWVGKILSTAPQTAYLQEPLNINNPFNLGCVPYWYYYINDASDLRQKEVIEHLIALSFDYWGALRHLKSFEDVGRYYKYGRLNWLAQKPRGNNVRTIIKDPLALFSSQWISSTFNADVLLLIRHPAAFVNSILRVGWGHPFSHFLQQRSLMSDELSEFQDEIEEFSREEKPLVDQAILLWKITHTQINKFQTQHCKDWVFIRHEDLSADPLKIFPEIFQALKLEYNQRTYKMLLDTTSSSNPRDTKWTHAHKRDSQANAYAWKEKLSSEEVKYIRSKVEPVSAWFYGAHEW